MAQQENTSPNIALDAARWRFTMLALDEDSLEFASMLKAAAKIGQAVETEAVVTACVDLAMHLSKS